MTNPFDKAQRIYLECVETGHYAPGFEALDRLILQGVDSCRSLQLRSHLHYLAGSKELALSDLEEAIALEPNSAGLFYDRGVLHEHCKEYGRALSDFCHAASLAQAVSDDDLIDAVEHHVIEVLDKMRSK